MEINVRLTMALLGTVIPQPAETLTYQEEDHRGTDGLENPGEIVERVRKGNMVAYFLLFKSLLLKRTACHHL